MSRQERERKARQKARLAAGGEAAGAAGGSQGDAPRSQTDVSLFPENPSPGELSKDLRLLNRAINERWATTSERRAALRRKLQERALDDKTPDHLFVAMVNADARLEAQNQRDDLAYDPFTGAPATSGGAAEGGDGEAAPVYQQINFYIPSNGRGQEPLASNGGGNS